MTWRRLYTIIFLFSYCKQKDTVFMSPDTDWEESLKISEATLHLALRWETKRPSYVTI